MRKRIALATGVLTVGLATTGFLTYRHGKPTTMELVGGYSDSDTNRWGQQLGDYFTETPQRPVYQYSIIPGGVYSKKELLALCAKYPNNPACANDLSGYHLVVLDRNVWLYAAYIKDGKLFWTDHPIEIYRGETVLEDEFGHLIRSRCGNPLSGNPLSGEAPPTPPEVEQPDITFNYFDSPPEGNITVVEIPPDTVTPVAPPAFYPLPPAASVTPQITPSSFGGIGGFGGTILPVGETITAPIETPEPSPARLLSAIFGAAIAAYFCHLFIKKEREKLK